MRERLKAELKTVTPHVEEVIEYAGRTCYNSLHKMGNPEIIKNWIKKGHLSTIEHSLATFDVTGVSRTLTHQLVRSRIASFSQRSQRYVEDDKFGYIIPPEIEKNDKAYKIFIDSMQYEQKQYMKLQELGIKKEDARFVLPNAAGTQIVVSMNFREFRHFFELRISKHAQWEIRELATNMLMQLGRIAPNVFGDQISNLLTPAQLIEFHGGNRGFDEVS